MQSNCTPCGNRLYRSCQEVEGVNAFSWHEPDQRGRSAWPAWLRRLCEDRSFDRLQQLPRFTQQIPNLLALGDRVAGEQAVPARVPVSPWCAGSRRTAVHPAAPLAAHRRRAARSAGADFCAATRARQHRTDAAGAIAHACALRPASPSETITLACCVTLPAMALPQWRAGVTSIVRRIFCPQSRRTARCWVGPWAFYKFREDGIVPVICPTRQNAFSGSLKASAKMVESGNRTPDPTRARQSYFL
jgi:hypothetical protein